MLGRNGGRTTMGGRTGSCSRAMAWSVPWVFLQVKELDPGHQWNLRWLGE